MKSKRTFIWVPGEVLDKVLSGEPLEIQLEAPCREPVVAWISIKKPKDNHGANTIETNVEVCERHKKNCTNCKYEKGPAYKSVCSECVSIAIDSDYYNMHAKWEPKEKEVKFDA